MDSTKKQKPTAPTLVIVPSPEISHLIPLTQLAQTLLLHLHNFTVTFIVPNDGSSMKPHRHLLHSLPTPISSIFLPPVSFDDLPLDAPYETRIALTLTRSLPALRHSFGVLTHSTRVVALIVDIFGVDAFDVAHKFGVPPYVFLPDSALILSLIFCLPELDELHHSDYGDLLELPGCVPVPRRDLGDAIRDKKEEAYKWILHIARKSALAAGIMVNSFVDLEPGAFEALMKYESCKPPVYPVGPLTRTGSIGSDGQRECLRWLDEQPNESVVYVCFGSGNLTQEQMGELAFGLEISGQRFIWVVKTPFEGKRCDDDDDEEDPFKFLPNGFLERTKGVGLVVPFWAPQVQVLSHRSTGGFLTHCGWNSILESMVYGGVPLIAWPLLGELKLNATLVAGDLKVALRVAVNENGTVGREDVASYARRIIEGDEGKLLRHKMRELKVAAAEALGKDGSSTKSLADVANILKKNHKY